MKYLIWSLFIMTMVSMLIGLTVELPYSNKLIGFGVIGLCAVVFPLFSYYRWKDKKMADYMLTPENLEKMREFNDSKKT
jgi:ABC-type antimicrobial peptide transport system permease subunit|tara:strand:+ start:504 stop:740 length:237 start_codon:yes stop_codon:yes gene_type:complete